MAEKRIQIDLSEAFKVRYRLRRTGYGQKRYNMVVSIPPVVIEKECERHRLSLAGFIKRFEAIAYYGSFPGCYVTFEELGAAKKEIAGEPEAEVKRNEWWFPGKAESERKETPGEPQAPRGGDDWWFPRKD
jgi:hypothetical protein